MMNRFAQIFIISLVLILTGCGSNDHAPNANLESEDEISDIVSEDESSSDLDSTVIQNMKLEELTSETNAHEWKQFFRAKNAKSIWYEMQNIDHEVGVSIHFSPMQEKDAQTQDYEEVINGTKKYLNLYNPNIESLELGADDAYPMQQLPVSFIDGLSGFHHLYRLQLYRVPLTTLPSTINTLNQLELLEINHAGLTHLPKELGKLTNLHLLQLDNNNLSSLPEAIGYLAQLEHLFLSHNQLKDLPPTIINLTELKTIDIANNQFQALPSYIGQFKQLEHLFLGNNQLKTLPERLQTINHVFIETVRNHSDSTSLTINPWIQKDQCHKLKKVFLEAYPLKNDRYKMKKNLLTPLRYGPYLKSDELSKELQLYDFMQHQQILYFRFVPNESTFAQIVPNYWIPYHLEAAIFTKQDLELLHGQLDNFDLYLVPKSY